MSTNTVSKKTPSAQRDNLKASHITVDVPRYSYTRKHFQDWEGNWHKTAPKAPQNAGNVNLKKIKFDTWSDTRSSWYNA
jgi:hypothetical protein